MGTTSDNPVLHLSLSEPINCLDYLDYFPPLTRIKVKTKTQDHSSFFPPCKMMKNPEASKDGSKS